MRKSFAKKNILDDDVLLSNYIKTGDIDFLGELYVNYIHLVYGVCLKYLKDREESKDAVNRIFELLIVEIPKFRIKNFKSWLYVVVKNYCLMEIRKSKTKKNWHRKYSEYIFMDSTDISHPIDEIPDEKLENKLKLCLEKLKREQQQCVQLFYYDNKCYKEIAEYLGISIGKVKSFIQNGKRNLKICLENQETDEG